MEYCVLFCAGLFGAAGKDGLMMNRTESGSYREILSIALPLVVSTSSYTVMHFTDRMFLSWYSNDALAAALPAGVTSFALLCLFLGPTSYISTFVAQYFGAQEYRRIGAIVWQGIYFALIAGVILMGVIPFSLHIFRLINHPGSLPILEASYFKILCYGFIFTLLSSVLSGFFIGLGRTRIVMIVNMFSAGLNIILDYAWIFGKFGFPRWGIQGAAWATVLSIVIGALIFIFLYLLGENRMIYGTLAQYRLNKKLFLRVLRYGLPNGVQFFLDIAAYTIFVLLVGRLGQAELAAIHIAFNINTIAFMPMLGFGTAATILVGQYLGKNKPEIAAQSVHRVFIITIAYMSLISFSYIFFPGIYVALYGSKENAALLLDIRRMSKILLLFVAFYSFFDSFNVIFCSAIRGAGDTRFIMWVSVLSSIFVVIIPSYITCVIYMGNVFLAWSFFTFYVIFVGVVFLGRYRSGKWKEMRVIEVPPAPLPMAPGDIAESEILL